MRPPGRVLVLRPGALGDALLAFPALAWLRQAWPRARVTLAARADVLALAEASGLAHQTRAFDDPVWSGLWSERAERDTSLRQALGGADAAVGWLGDPDGVVERSLRALGIARVVIAPGRPAASSRDHVALHLARTLAPLGMAELPDSLAALARATPRIVPSMAGARVAEALWQAHALASARVVALHPGSGGAAKCWPADRFAAVVRLLAEAGYRPLVLEGPADRAPVARLLAACAAACGAAGPPAVARELSVEALAGVLACCAGYLGNDSGVSHLAALAGCPTLTLFGPSDPARWAPIGPRTRVCSSPGDMDALPVATVWDELRALL